MEESKKGAYIVSIDSPDNQNGLEERLLESIDGLAERAKDIVRIALPIVEEILAVVRSTERAFAQSSGPSQPGAATSTQYPQSGKPWADNSKLAAVLGIGAAGCLLMYLMGSRR
jgi:hypothetical protein